MMKRTALLRRTRIPRVSKKRAKLNAIFARKKKAFLKKHPVCQVWLANNKFTDRDVAFLLVRFESNIPASVDVHHKHWAMKYYLDESTWMAVSREAHDWIEAHKSAAEARGWIIR